MKKAPDVRREDFDRLRALGFTEMQIRDIASCGPLPSFLSRLLGTREAAARIRRFPHDLTGM